jgi:hypothetical protein
MRRFETIKLRELFNCNCRSELVVSTKYGLDGWNDIGMRDLSELLLRLANLRDRPVEF